MIVRLGLGQFDMAPPGVQARRRASQIGGIPSSPDRRPRRWLLALACGLAAAALAEQPTPPDVAGSLAPEMVWIEPGAYWRGSPPEEAGHRTNETRHRVTLTHGFWLGATEVTQAQYLAVMGENPSAFPDDRRPAENVAWFEWVVFCNRLSAREHLAPAYRIEGTEVVWDRSADGYRLPTEAEWEYACRAGTTTRFSVGDRTSELLAVAWFRANADWQTHPVADKPANPWGLHDMHGNVFEWCWDWYAPYDGQDLVDPTGPEETGRRVLRGGGWGSYSRGCRSAFRMASEPSSRRAWFGARLARGAVP